MKTAKNASGFTLIELLITTTLLVIIATIAVPSFSELIDDMRNRQAGRELFSLMNYARSMAVTRRQRVIVCGSSDGRFCDGNWNGIIIVFADTNNNRRRDGDDPLLRASNNMPKQSQLSIGSLDNYLRYKPDGRLIRTGSFLYCPPDRDARKGWIIVFYISGRAYFGRDYNGDGIAERGTTGKNLSC